MRYRARRKGTWTARNDRLRVTSSHSTDRVLTKYVLEKEGGRLGAWIWEGRDGAHSPVEPEHSDPELLVQEQHVADDLRVLPVDHLVRWGMGAGAIGAAPGLKRKAGARLAMDDCDDGLRNPGRAGPYGPVRAGGDGERRRR